MDWIEDADLFIKTHTTSPRDVYAEAKRVVRHGIEEVRALRKERGELKTKVDKMHGVQAGLESWNLELKREVERLEKERDELWERVARLERAHFIPEKTLRDEFAQWAMDNYMQDSYDWLNEQIASMSYKIADAMLEARKK